MFLILNDINCYKDNVHVFFVIEFYINMFIVCKYVLDGECSATCGNGRQKYHVKCPYIRGYDIENKGNNKITELRTILQRESQNS